METFLSIFHTFCISGNQLFYVVFYSILPILFGMIDAVLSLLVLEFLSSDVLFLEAISFAPVPVQHWCTLIMPEFIALILR